MTENRDEVTVEQAASLLNVSSAFSMKLLDEGMIPFRTKRQYRSIRLNDLLAYKYKDDETGARIADELTVEAQELGGMGY